MCKLRIGDGIHFKQGQQIIAQYVFSHIHLYESKEDNVVMI